MPEARTISLFDDQQIRAAEKVLVSALCADDRTAWVYEYTEDAVFDGGGEPVRGRDALLEEARTMAPMRALSLRPLRTEGNGDLATVWVEGSWESGPQDSGRRVDVRGILVWRKEADGHWRVAMEHLRAVS